MTPQPPTLLPILSLERARRDGQLSEADFDAQLARLKVRDRTRAVPWRTILLLVFSALIIAGLALS